MIFDQLAACSQHYRIAFCIPWPVALGGPVKAIYWYTITVVISLGIGALVALRHMKQEGADIRPIINGVFLTLLVGMTGARLLFHLLRVWGGEAALPQENLWDSLVMRGGVNTFGFLTIGVLVAHLYGRLIGFKNHPMGFDGVFLGIWIAHAFYRIGNAINRELYGPPTGSGWFGMTVPEEMRISFYPVSEYPLETRFHPSMIYEMIWLFVTFGLVCWWLRRNHDRYIYGSISAAFLILHGLGRLILESGLRPDQARIPGTPVSFAFLFSLVELLLGILIMLDRLGKIHIPFFPPPTTAGAAAGTPPESISHGEPTDPTA